MGAKKKILIMEYMLIVENLDEAEKNIKNSTVQRFIFFFFFFFFLAILGFELRALRLVDPLPLEPYIQLFLLLLFLG
jgi:hypothetical protein